MVMGLLKKFWRGSYLVVAFRFDFTVHFALVKHVACTFEIVFHHVNVVFIVLHVDARVSNQQYTEIVEAFRDFLAFNSDFIGQLTDIIALVKLKVNIQVDDWHVFKVSADNVAVRVQSASLAGVNFGV